MLKSVTILFSSLFVLSACITVNSPVVDSVNGGAEDNINSFEDCIAAGNPAMESYPRQCRTKDGQYFVEEIVKEDIEEEYKYDLAGRRYVSKDKGQCLRMLYFCNNEEESFTDNMGCGCKLKGYSNNVTDTTDQDSEVICTQQYDPVCGQIEVQCIKAPCPPLWTDFSNNCFAQGSGAKNIQKGTCERLNL